MTSDVIKYRDWLLEADRLQTAGFYESIQSAGSEDCICGNCKYFNTISNHIYPDEVKLLFKELGVDINKNFEVNDFGDETTGHLYYGSFHFIGKIIEGKDCSIPLQSGGYTVDLLPISESFSIGFTSAVSKSFFNKDQNLVQIEFAVKASNSHEKNQ